MPLSDIWRAALSPDGGGDQLSRDGGGDQQQQRSDGEDGGCDDGDDETQHPRPRSFGRKHGMYVKMGIAKKNLQRANEVAKMDEQQQQRICRVAFGSWAQNLSKGNSKVLLDCEHVTGILSNLSQTFHAFCSF